MRIKPILFNTEMVRAILAGRKTVTRRVVKPQPRAIYHDGKVCDDDGLYIVAENQNGGVEQTELPYRPGDILYVREAFFEHRGHFYYKADGKHEALARFGITFKWHPSIHMPREAARIFLRVADVRVERLQDIDSAGALAEGCDGRCEGPQDGALSDYQKSYDFSIERFQTIWDTTIKPADRALYGWEANPWVWVIEFERRERPEEL